MPEGESLGSADSPSTEQPGEATPSYSPSLTESGGLTAGVVDGPDEEADPPGPRRDAFPVLYGDPLLGSFKDMIGSGLLGSSALSPLAGIHSSLSKLAALQVAAVSPIIEMPALQIPNLAQLVGKPLLDSHEEPHRHGT